MDHPHPIVSIIIPTYNQADLLQKALESVISQTYNDWEALVIDNNSEDHTQEIIASINDPRIRYLAFSNKGIIAASRNLGIRQAGGDYIAFLDSDDLWYPSKLSICLDRMRRGADAICHGLWIRKDGILENTLIPTSDPQNIYKTLLYFGNQGIATSAVMVKKKCFDQFEVFSEDPGMITAEDYELWIRLSKNNIRWEFIHELLGEYTVHGKNASGNVKRQMLAEENVVNKYFREIHSPRTSEWLSYRKRRMMLVFCAGKRVWQSGRYWASIPYFFTGISRLFC